MVYDETWDETAEELVSISSSGDKSNTFEDWIVNIKKRYRDCPIFSHFGGRFEIYTPLSRVKMGLFGEQNRPE